MHFKTLSIIRLAQIFEESGLHTTADIIDSSMLRIALDMSDLAPEHDNVTAKYKAILDNAYRSRFKVKPGDANFVSYRNEESYWVYPDGSVVLLNGERHGDALLQIEQKYKNESGDRLSKDPEYHAFKDRYLDNYHMVANTLGAIRVYADAGSHLVVTSYTIPTQAQINTIENIKMQWGNPGYNIEQFGYVLGQRARFDSIPLWEMAIEKYQRASAASQAQHPSSQFQDAIHNIDEANQSLHSPLWKIMDNKRLHEEYPGDENAPLRKMYERSAGIKTANQLELEFDAQESPQDMEQDGKDRLWASWMNTYPLKQPAETIKHTDGGMDQGSQSFWILPDGSRIELGTTWHGTALGNVIRKNGLEEHEGVKQMMKNHNQSYYSMMAGYYGAIRIYAYSRTLSGSSYTIPTEEQFNTIADIQKGLGLSQFEIDQEINGKSEYFYSLEDWKHAMESMRPPKPQRSVDILIDSHNNNDMPLWKMREKRNLEERYPGDENARFRKMYMRSAGTRTASRDDYYKRALEEGHKARFNVIEPEGKVDSFRNMHSFWLYPDGSLMDLGRQWHEDAFNEVMQDARLDEEEEFGNMYSSKDGPHEIMSDYFGMIRLFIQDKNVLIVTSYRKPTQAQINQIQSVSQQSGRSVIKIEQFGFVPGGRLVTNSMSKWVEELSKYKPNAHGQSSYNTMRNNIEEANDSAQAQPYWKAKEQQSLEQSYPGPENEQLRKMYERSASNE